MIIELDLPLYALEKLKFGFSGIPGFIQNIKIKNIKTQESYVIVDAIASGLLFRTSTRITFQLQLKNGKIVAHHVSATGIASKSKDLLASRLNSIFEKNLNNIFIHHLDIGSHGIRISCSPQ